MTVAMGGGAQERDPALARRDDAPGEVLSEAAPAKVNLFLHLRGLRADGYHLLESLAVFPAVGDRLEAKEGLGLSLEIGGPFGWNLSADDGNLVLRAARALAAAEGIMGPQAAIRLIKNLPVASGIGGGSSDAAATLRLLSRLWHVPVPERLAEGIGADVPVCCRAPAPSWMEGIGERLSPGPALPPFWMVLANPMQTVETRVVFRATAKKDQPAAEPAPARGFDSFEDLVGWLSRQRSDLEPAARALCPEIGDVLEALSAAPLARMSGSGATCFAIHADEAAATAQANALRAARPAWWVAAAPVAAV